MSLEQKVKEAMAEPELQKINLDDFKVAWDNYAKQVKTRRKTASIAEEKPIAPENLEANQIRIDLDEAAKTLAKMEIEQNFPGMEIAIDETSTPYLKLYDKYYDVLFKAKV